MNSLKKLFRDHREAVLYLVFGVLTTLVSWITYGGAFWVAEHGLDVPLQDKQSTVYLATYLTIQALQWVVAVLFAFFTNRRWVFQDADRRTGAMGGQLVRFSGSRLLTLGLDVLVTYGLIALLSLWMSENQAPSLAGITFNAEMVAKLAASVLVVIANYFLSKWFVFKKPSDNAERIAPESGDGDNDADAH